MRKPFSCIRRSCRQLINLLAIPSILQKHIKRQIISLNGGFQVIADLNAYYTFIASLKVPTIAAEFSYLKMLGHVYVVEDAKDLAQIVRDVTRYGGAYRPEVSFAYYLYSFQLNQNKTANLYSCRMCTSLFRDGQTGRRSRKQSIRPCTISASRKIALSAKHPID